MTATRAPSRERAFWVQPQSKDAFTTALECGVTDFIFINDKCAQQYAKLGRFSLRIVNNDGRFEGGRWVSVDGPGDVDTVSGFAGTDEVVVIDTTDWKAIPAENIIAAYRGTPTRLYAVVPNAPDARAMLAMLEVGTDGVVLRADNPAVVREFVALRDTMRADNAGDLGQFTTATVSAVVQTGVGERVCVDTCSLLSPCEGMLVGSTSQSLGVVLSEAAESEYISSRPFRVNAGAVHMYVAVPGGKTKYLCELRGGDEVLVYDVRRRSYRSAVVGRAKVETRPLTMVKVNIEDGKSATMFVQNAETVRLATSSDDEVTATSVAALQVGDQIVLRVDSVARHMGLAIDENIEEK